MAERPGNGSDALPPQRRPTLLSSTSLTFATQLSVAALSLLNVLVVSRALGPTGRGEVVFLTTISFLSAQFATLSISEALSNIAGRSPERRPALAANATILAVALGTLAAGLLAGLILAFPDLGPHVSWQLKALALAAIAPLILQTYFERIVLADYGFRVINAAWLATPALTLTVNAILAALGVLSVASAFAIWVIGQLTALALLSWYLAQRMSALGRPDRPLAREMVSFGLKAHGSRLMMWGNYRLDQWLVGAMAGARELGLYSVAVALAEGLYLLSQAFTYSLRPDLVRVGPREAGRQAAAAFRVVTLVSIPAVAVVVAAAPFLCVTIFGPGFHGSIADLRVLAAGAFGMAAIRILGSSLIAQRRPLLETIATATAFAATIALDLLLIPKHGGFGAALASTAAYTAGGAVIALIASRVLLIPARALIPGPADLGAARGAAHGLVRRATARDEAGVAPSDPR